MASYAASASTTKSTRRYWRRTDTPRPWWPRGLLPILGLVVLFLFGALVTAPAIQAEVRQSVAQRLDGAGVTASEITADGRRVHLRIGADGPDTVFAQALARSTGCATWAGVLNCPATVAVEREAGPAVAASRPHRFEVVRDGESVILSGEVPSLAERERIVGLAGQIFAGVEDRMRVSNEAAGANYEPAADRAIAVLGRLVSGKAT